MLDLTVLLQELTQGQPLAEMVLPSNPSASVAVTVPAASANAPAPSGGAAPVPAGTQGVEARRVAERVYELMQRDLLVANERRGRH